MVCFLPIKQSTSSDPSLSQCSVLGSLSSSSVQVLTMDNTHAEFMNLGYSGLRTLRRCSMGVCV